MNMNKNEWSDFLESGKIDDYLNYCRKRKQELYASVAEGVSDADEDRRDYPVGPQKR